MIKFITKAVVVALLGGCTSHVALLALDKQADNQQQYIDKYDEKVTTMEVEDYE